MKTQWSLNSSIGKLHLVASERALEGIYFKKQNAPSAKSLKSSEPSVRILARADRQLKEYFRGKRTRFDIPLDLQGTAFQKSVWKALSAIPYGRTASYRDVARRIRKPKAVRAVGSANGANPACIIVPCHRVIAADGSIGGYAGGLKKKRALLGIEGVR